MVVLGQGSDDAPWCGQVMASHEHNAVVVSMGTTAGKPEDTGCEPTWENVREAIASVQQL